MMDQVHIINLIIYSLHSKKYISHFSRIQTLLSLIDQPYTKNTNTSAIEKNAITTSREVKQIQV